MYVHALQSVECAVVFEIQTRSSGQFIAGEITSFT